MHGHIHRHQRWNPAIRLLQHQIKAEHAKEKKNLQELILKGLLNLNEDGKTTISVFIRTVRGLRRCWSGHVHHTELMCWPVGVCGRYICQINNKILDKDHMCVCVQVGAPLPHLSHMFPSVLVQSCSSRNVGIVCSAALTSWQLVKRNKEASAPASSWLRQRQQAKTAAQRLPLQRYEPFINSTSRWLQELIG